MLGALPKVFMLKLDKIETKFIPQKKTHFLLFSVISGHFSRQN